MALKTGRAEGTASVVIDYQKCTACGLCVAICKGAPLYMEGKKVKVDQARVFGCIGCGQCMAVCPRDCITVTGRAFSPEDVIPLPPAAKRAGFDALKNLMLSRRSVRKFKDKPVVRAVIEKIVDAVATAPMGLPPSDVEILVVDRKEKVREFAEDIIAVMAKSKFLFGLAGRTLLRPLFGKIFAETAATFIYPAISYFEEALARGEDSLFYGAPLVLYFHASPYADPVDAQVAATYAMLAAESLGLGSCMIGTPAYFIKYSGKLKEKYGIPPKNNQGIAVIFGHPAVKFRKALKRSLGGVRYY
ncbi:MAG TPA: 4Fe-4S dicluster domain-containing protein [Spirochaetes bacterium]|nr:4Fe-4S dicluster domain-containing protein [Spirochaetota bacterium]